MQGWFENNDISLYSHNERNSVITERFRKTLKIKIYKKMTATVNKFYLSHLNKLAGQCNNTYHYSINKKYINAHYSALTEKIETNPKAPKFKVNDTVRITKYKNIFCKD